ncbi:hypothetical protein GCM10010421_33410 [Streptomyces glaucus]|uniref:Secreted protein n=1 Tax=Streptomyces glaucus TaxID=284029 RepID=A0ABP5X2I3_9ACTN
MSVSGAVNGRVTGDGTAAVTPGGGRGGRHTRRRRPGRWAESGPAHLRRAAETRAGHRAAAAAVRRMWPDPPCRTPSNKITIRK